MLMNVAEAIIVEQILFVRIPLVLLLALANQVTKEMDLCAQKLNQVQFSPFSLLFLIFVALDAN